MTPPLFELPLIYCPIESAIHPQLDELERKGIEWIDTFKLAKGPDQRIRLIETKSAELSALALPTADAARVQPYANWTYWGFAIDDFWEDPSMSDFNLNHLKEWTAELLRVFEGSAIGASSSNPFVVSFQDIVDNARAYATPDQIRRLAMVHIRWFSAVREEIVHQVHREAFNLKQCMNVRFNAAAGSIAAVFLEMANPFGEIPDNEMNHSTTRALTELFSMIVAIDNDIFSFHKEFFQNDQMPANIVDAVARKYGDLSPQDAVKIAISMRDRMMSLFLRLRNQVIPHASEALSAYLTDLGHHIRGHIEWSLRTRRYTTFYDSTLSTMWAPNFPGWSSKPSDENLDPLLFETVAWCWNELKP
jgi:hypothetical protein